MKIIVEGEHLDMAVNSAQQALEAVQLALNDIKRVTDWAMEPEKPEKPPEPPKPDPKPQKLDLSVVKIPIKAGHLFKTFTQTGVILSVMPTWVTSHSFVEQDGEYLVAFGSAPPEDTHIRLVIAEDK